MAKICGKNVPTILPALWKAVSVFFTLSVSLLFLKEANNGFGGSAVIAKTTSYK